MCDGRFGLIFWQRNLLRFASAICLTFQMYVATVVLFGPFHCTFHGTCCFCHRWSWQATSANIFNTPPTQTAAAVILGQVVHSVHICHALSKTWLHDDSMFRISSESFQVFSSCLYIFVTMICPFSRWFSPGLFVPSLENPTEKCQATPAQPPDIRRPLTRLTRNENNKSCLYKKRDESILCEAWQVEATGLTGGVSWRKQYWWPIHILFVYC